MPKLYEIPNPVARTLKCAHLASRKTGSRKVALHVCLDGTLERPEVLGFIVEWSHDIDPISDSPLGPSTFHYAANFGDAYAAFQAEDLPGDQE